MKKLNLNPVLEGNLDIHKNKVSLSYNYDNYLTGTITLKPSVYSHASGMGRNAKSQLMMTADKLNDKISGYASDHIMVAEITKSGNIHYHLLLKPKEDYSIDLLKDDLKPSKLFGFVSIVRANNQQHHDTFKDYILKDYKKTMTIINKSIKHEDDIKDIVFLPSSIKRIKTSNGSLGKWLDSQSESDASLPFPLDDFILQSYSN